MEINFVYILFLSSIGFIISFIGGMVGLVLGVIRLPFILSTGLSVTESVGTNIGVSTLGAITAVIQQRRMLKRKVLVNSACMQRWKNQQRIIRKWYSSRSFASIATMHLVKQFVLLLKLRTAWKV